MPAGGAVAREDANEPDREVGGSLLVRTGPGLVVAGLAVVALALLCAVLPISRPHDAGAVTCGRPVTAVGRADPGDGLAGLGRLPPGGGGEAEPIEEALARLTRLERDVEWYRACHRPAATRMAIANVAVALGAAVALAGVVLRRRKQRSVLRLSR